MCTVSWRTYEEGYDLLFNRDELHSRGLETPPSVSRRPGTAIVAPRDADRGGTWISLNAFGITCCLLNDYAPGSTSPDTPSLSRGEIVSGCAGATCTADAVTLVLDQPLHQIAPFYLLVIAPREAPLLLHWQGTRLETLATKGLMPMLSSSSFSTRSVIASRRRRFAEAVGCSHRADLTDLERFHRHHDPAEGAYSILMRRPDAATRSISQVSVTLEHARFSYRSVSWTNEGPCLSPAVLCELGIDVSPAVPALYRGDPPSLRDTTAGIK
jgi:hypothetical protein